MASVKKEVVLGLGSNIGKSKDILETAKDLINNKIGTIVSCSKLYYTQAWGVEKQPNFYNQCIIVETDLSPYELLNTTQSLENLIVRKKEFHWGPRQIDIDILFYADYIIDEDNLKIPHSLLHIRRFVLEPLNEIAPELIHPILNKSVASLLISLKDKKIVSAL